MEYEVMDATVDGPGSAPAWRTSKSEPTGRDPTSAADVRLAETAAAVWASVERKWITPGPFSSGVADDGKGGGRTSGQLGEQGLLAPRAPYSAAERDEHRHPWSDYHGHPRVHFSGGVLQI